jgi:amino acid adenylation domain-containing protein
MSTATESRLSLGARFVHAVELHADATAVIEGGKSLDYGAVADRVQGFADEFLRRRLATDDAVAVLALGSAASWQAILGASVAGVPWVPIDARQPEPIVRHILENSGARICVGFSARTQAAAARYCDYVDGTDVRPAPWARQSARLHASPDDLAYVIYTSGSTGMPKGVMIGEDALAGFLDWMAQHEGLSRRDRVFQNHSIGFDNSIWEMLSPLACGATLVFPGEDDRQDYECFLRTIEQVGVTILNATPQQMTTFMNAADILGLAPFRSIRRLYTGAETVTHAAAARILRALPPEAYVANEYGPTEATITCTLGPINDAVLRESAAEPSVPIGWAMGDAVIQVRDGDRRCIDAGETGELWVGGRCVARGYRGLPRETAERFFVDPWGDGDGSRWYRTGDLVRITAHGFVFLGRMDGQVKVRGNRIETAALESAVSRLPGVVQAAAVPVGGVEGGYEALWLFVVCVPAGKWERDAVHAELLQALPYYMVPDRIVMHDGALPLTVNGKLDRDSLIAAARRNPRGY